MTWNPARADRLTGSLQLLWTAGLLPVRRGASPEFRPPETHHERLNTVPFQRCASIWGQPHDRETLLSTYFDHDKQHLKEVELQYSDLCHEHQHIQQ
ncbi:uncharacterized protein J3D65DRAFT_406337 [Phyllosticta citribraziliensis]|uniref:Uncharacterized protein n=1 Tax=Phyllosticta citribraziliensis TaxID=989973 RepID=A0ABR1LLS7_9PEZI